MPQVADGSVLGVIVDIGGAAAGIEGGAAIGAGLIGVATLFRLGAAFLATTLALGLAFLGAALTAFFATLTALPVFLAFAFAGRAFFFATLFLAAVRLAGPRLAFATGRFFFDLLFFAMVTLLLEIVRTRRESSPEKVCCHLCMTLESVTWIA